MKLTVRSATLLGLTVLVAATASGQLRVANWNVTNYSSGRVAAFQTSIYGEYEGRTFAPDLLIGQEFLSQAGVTNFLNILNTADGSPGDWAAAPYIDGPDTDNAFFYRTSKVEFIAVTTIANGGSAPNHPRNVERYDVRLIGYGEPGVYLACYSAHMKSGTSSTDKARRLLEAQHIRDDAETLPDGWHFILGGDFNIQSSSQSAYQELVGAQADDSGRLHDPIATPGNWNNTAYFRYVHTQDPSGAGGMDDRHDQLLVSAGLVDGDGFDYIGDPCTPYSSSSWYDANHSYRSWGNDGTSYNASLTISGNDMVGSVIAQALVATTSQGHLPVFLDLRVPPCIDSTQLVDFGQVVLNDDASMVLEVFNSGDVQLWSEAGIAELEYEFNASDDFLAPNGMFAAVAGEGAGLHVIEMNTDATGVFEGTLAILSNAPEEPERIVRLSGVVVAQACPGDLNGDGGVGLSDLAQLLSHYGETTLVAYSDGDLDSNGRVDLADLAELLSVYGVNCQP